MNSKLLQASIESRNREAIQKLVNLEALKSWGRNKDLPLKERNQYYAKVGENYLSPNKV